ncbi:MAG TPA: lipopolysaccharide heptosyltransferase II [Candidatus Acidoferrales bacterium]|nr:lipopolysaccharide heptosyltransferase II [Candidatus Acidoferrales bacterium]
MAFNPSSVSRLCVRATNWLGDAVMSLPAIRAIRHIFPHAHIAVVARPWVADLYARESCIDVVIPYPARPGWRAKREFARRLGHERFDAAILLQNAFDAALITWLAGIPERIGYNRDGRGWLLTHAIAVPEPGDIPRHERFYYLELLRRAGMLERFPESDAIRLDGIGQARAAGIAHMASLGITGPVIGISPGAAYGDAKRWLPERFAEAAQASSSMCPAVLLFGSASEQPLCETVAAQIRRARGDVRGDVPGDVRDNVRGDVLNLAGATSLREFIDLAAACRLFLTNDSGAMHVASALGVPTVAVFGATDDTTTGPTGPRARVIREHAECSPCLLRECPIDHRCMTAVTSERVAAAVLQLWEESAPAWTPEAKS